MKRLLQTPEAEKSDPTASSPAVTGARCLKECFLPGVSSKLELLVDGSYRSTPFSPGGQSPALALKRCCCGTCVYFTGENTPAETVACQEGRDVEQHRGPANRSNASTKGSRIQNYRSFSAHILQTVQHCWDPLVGAGQTGLGHSELYLL